MDQKAFVTVYSTRDASTTVAGPCAPLPQIRMIQDLPPEAGRSPSPKSKGAIPESSSTRFSTYRPRLNDQDSDRHSVATAKLSHCSSFSRVTVDRNLFLGILRNRKEHALFSGLEPSNAPGTLWFYLDDRENNHLGPFSAPEMDRRFHLELLNEQTQIRRKLDDDFRPLSFFVKSYYKNVLCEQHDVRDPARRLKTKVVRFQAEEELPRRRSRMSDAPKPLNREERFFSQSVRPLASLQNMIPSEEDEIDLPPEQEQEEEEEGFETEICSRDRSTTLTQLSERPRIK